MTQRAEASARKAALIMHLCDMTDDALEAARVKELTLDFGVYWLVASRQKDIEIARRRERVAE